MGCGAFVRQDTYLEDDGAVRCWDPQTSATWTDPVTPISDDGFALGGEWQYEESLGTWLSFGPEINAQLLVAWYCGDTKVVYSAAGTSHEVDFQTFVQTDQQTGVQQRVGWVSSSAHADEAGDEETQGEGVWIEYTGDTDDILRAWAAGHTLVYYTADGCDYEVDFVRMVEKNWNTGEERSLGLEVVDDVGNSTGEAVYHQYGADASVTTTAEEHMPERAPQSYSYVGGAKEDLGMSASFSTSSAAQEYIPERTSQAYAYAGGTSDNRVAAAVPLVRQPQAYSQVERIRESFNIEHAATPVAAERAPQAYSWSGGARADLGRASNVYATPTSQAEYAQASEQQPTQRREPQSYALQGDVGGGYQDVNGSSGASRTPQGYAYGAGQGHPYDSNTTYSYSGAGQKEDVRSAPSAAPAVEAESSAAAGATGAANAAAAATSSDSPTRGERSGSKKFSLGQGGRTRTAGNASASPSQHGSYQTPTGAACGPTTSPMGASQSYKHSKTGQPQELPTAGRPPASSSPPEADNSARATETHPPQQSAAGGAGGHGGQQGRPQAKARTGQAAGQRQRPGGPPKKWSLGPERQETPHVNFTVPPGPPPPQSGAQQGYGGSGDGGAGGRPAPARDPSGDGGSGAFAMPNGIKLPENPQARRVLETLVRDMQKSKKAPMQKRRQAYKVACLSWHPDKNQKHVALATEIFQVLQELKPWYLQE
mmetsp:Transcript_154117/g.492867  ORF Transcript_154117/g.492867 Transcript_154117/m.492867 type:complete len:711 (-) Transcript_154117:414-2546(-)